MIDDLIQHFKSSIPVSSDLEEALADCVAPRSFQKSEIVHDAVDVCTEAHFVRSGLMRLYLLENGQQVSEYFAGADDWINSPRSFTNRVTDIYYIDAIEDTRTYALNIEDLGVLFSRFPEMEDYARQSMSGMLAQTLEKVTSLRTHNALEKYEKFKVTYPDIHARIPLGMIASYLGMTPETLSRIRAQPKT